MCSQALSLRKCSESLSGGRTCDLLVSRSARYHCATETQIRYLTRCLTKQNLCPRFSRCLRQLASAFVRFARVRFARVRFARVRFARVA